jgi:hypothetical protein
VIGVIVAGIVVKGGFEILSNAKEAKQSDSAESAATEK